MDKVRLAKERKKTALPPPREPSPLITDQELKCCQEVQVQFANLVALATRMSAEIGLADHRYPVFRVYEKCFIGNRAVDWMLRKRLASSEKAALVLGNLMLQSGLIYHVMLQHPFENEKLYYR